jgi:hypothetical protein
MAQKVSNRKTLQEILDAEDEPEINPDHVNDWQVTGNSFTYKALQEKMRQLNTGNFNFTAAISAPKSIRYRQRNCDWHEGQKGDYLFVSANGGRMCVPYKIFKLLF